MNKSFVTNIVALSLWLVGMLIPDSSIKPYIYNIGLFALAGAATNWLAVHMLFEKIPGLYGSGVIQARFEEFKAGILKLVMENFFTEENFQTFAHSALDQGIDAKQIEEQIDFDEIFDGFLEVVKNSKFGGMLSMFGGLQVLEPLREPFIAEFKVRIENTISKLDLSKTDLHFDSFLPTVEKLVKGKLDQLEPKDVKQIIEKMIRDHLGWLVVWGGVCGAAIGAINILITTF
tara:strand:- start:1748 stop:2443 length:696 start_codon:yes stop_codon:yes gene_type:complete